jgi:predicted ester cyclase
MSGNSATESKKIVDRFVELFTEGNWSETLHEVIAQDCAVHYPGKEDVVGLDAIIENWAESFGEMKDLDWTIHMEATEGDIHSLFLTWRFNFEGEYMGKKLSGVPVELNQVEFMRFEDGKIKEWWIEQDQLYKARQLGMELRW